MSTVVIAIAYAPEGAPAPAAVSTALVDACSEAVRIGTCSLDEPEHDSMVPAVVHFDADERRVIVDVGPEGRAQSRTLYFGDGDPRLERFRSVGLTIATLANEVAGATASNPEETKMAAPSTEQNPPKPPAREQPKERAAPRGPSATKSPNATWFDAFAGVGPARGNGSIRVGAGALAAWRPTHAPIFGQLAAAYGVPSTEDRGVSLAWATFALGVGGVVESPSFPIRLEPRVAFALNHTEASTAGSAAEASGGRWGYGIRAGAGAIWRLGLVSPLVLAEAAFDDRATNILVENRLVTRVSEAGVDFFVGIRLTPP